MYQQINLYQPIFRKQWQIFSAATMAQAFAVVAVALLAIYGYGLAQVRAVEAEVLELEGRERALTTQLTRIDPDLGNHRRAELEAELGRLTATLEEQQRLEQALRERPLGNSGFSRYLAAFGRRRTAELWLTAIAINGSTGAIELAGRSRHAALVPEFMERLGEEEALTGQTFDRFEIAQDEATGEAVFRATSRAAAAAEAPGTQRAPQ
jgi:hypothetical protein